MDLELLCRKRDKILADTKTAYKAAIELAEKEDRALTDEEQSAFEDGKAKAAGIETQIRSLKAISDAENALTAPQPRKVTDLSLSPSDGDSGNDFKVPAVAKRQVGNFASPEEAYKAGMFCRAVLFGHEKSRQFCETHGIPIRAALNEGDNTAGGVLVPDPMIGSILDYREEFGVFSRFADIVTMSSETANRPRKTAGLTAYPTAELAAATESQSAFDRVSLVARKWTAFTRLSNEVLDDAIIDLATDVARDMGIAFATAEDNAGFIGTGANATYGGITGLAVKINDSNHAGSIHTAGAANLAFSTLDKEDFEAMVGKLPTFPGMQPVWHISKKGWAASMLRLLNDGGGNTGADLANRIEGQFLGYPVVINNSTNSTLGDDASKIKLFLGDLRMAAMLGRRSGVSIATDSSLYFKTGELAVKGDQRFDINVHSLGDGTSAGPIIALKTPAS